MLVPHFIGSFPTYPKDSMVQRSDLCSVQHKGRETQVRLEKITNGEGSQNINGHIHIARKTELMTSSHIYNNNLSCDKRFALVNVLLQFR